MDHLTSDRENNSTAIELLISKQNCVLEFFNLNYQPKASANILKNVSGQFKSGRLVAILGPSGAGKSSFLNILSGFKDTGVKGTVLFNGEPQNSTDIRKMSSYIPQNFALLDHLTTIETLTIAAEFKIGFKIKKCAREKVVHEIIELLSLEKCSKTLVKNLSGGEQKRLSIGVELVTNPPIMFLDEPTSGLDSVSSYQVVKHLQVSARTGRIIVCVIHQPSSRLLNLFDDVLILSGGECIYGGPLNDMVNTFQDAGYICPQYYNRAEYAVEVASKEYGEDLSALTSKNHEKYKLKEGNGVMHDSNRGNNFVQNMFISSIKNKNGSKKYQADFWEQLYILIKRSFLTLLRDKASVHIRLTSHIVIGLLLGAVFFNIGNNASRVGVNSSFVFFLVQFIFFANVLPNLLSCPLEVAVFLREHLNNWYAISPYFLAKFVSDIPLLLLCPTFIVVVAYFLTGQPPELFRFTMFWSISVLTAVLGQCMGLVLGSTFSMKNAIFLVPTICIPMLVFSGRFIHYDELPAIFSPMPYISFFRYAYEGSILALYGYNRTALDCPEMFCYYRYPTKFLKDMAMESDMWPSDISALFIWTFLLQILFLTSLFIKVKMSQ